MEVDFPLICLQPVVAELSAQQLDRVQCDQPSDPLDRAEREVALPAFKAAHVGAMDPNEIGEGFLAQPPLLAVAPQILTYGPLKIAFHEAPDVPGLLLVGLQTYE